MITTTIEDAETVTLLGWDDLTPDEKREFPYLDTDVLRADAEFVRYRGDVFDTGELEAAENRLRECGWTGFKPRSLQGGVVFKYIERGSAAQMARYTLSYRALPGATTAG